MARALECLIFMLICLNGKGQGEELSDKDDLRYMAHFMSALGNLNAQERGKWKQRNPGDALLFFEGALCFFYMPSLMANQEMTADTNDGMIALREEVAYLKEEVEELKSSLGCSGSRECQAGMVNINPTGIQCPKCRRTQRITFSPHFAKPPKVVYAFSTLDNINKYNLRIVAKMSDITIGGATLTVHTWAKTHIYAAAISWMACP